MITLNENIMNFINEVQQNYFIESINYRQYANEINIEIQMRRNLYVLTLVSYDKDRYFVKTLAIPNKIEEIKNKECYTDDDTGYHDVKVDINVKDVLCVNIEDNYYKGINEYDWEDLEDDISPTNIFVETVKYEDSKKLIELIRKYFKGRIYFDDDMEVYLKEFE